MAGRGNGHPMQRSQNAASAFYSPDRGGEGVDAPFTAFVVGFRVFD
jgi:hypothetical protein